MAIDIIARGMIESSKTDISQLFDITKGGETVSGESSYTLNNAVDYPLLALNLYGKSTQDGEPSPDNPVDIVSVGDSGSVEITADNGEKSTAASITSALPLCGIPVSEGGNYTDSNGQQWICDELIYNADGTGKIVKYCSATILSASNITNIIKDDNYGNFFDTNIVGAVSTSTNHIKPLSNRFLGVTYTDRVASDYINTFRCFISDIGHLLLRVANSENDKFSSLDDMRNFVDSNDVYIVYQLAEPQEIELTTAEMSQLRQLQTFDGVTSISNSAGAKMSVKYCTNKALSEYVLPITKGLQAQIDELRAAVLSLGGNV